LAGGRRVEGFQLLDSRKTAHRIADGPVQAVKDGNAPERGGPDGVAMVGPVEGDEAPTLRFAGALAVLRGHAAGAFDGGGTVVAEEDAGQRIARHDLDELCGEADGGF